MVLFSEWKDQQTKSSSPSMWGRYRSGLGRYPPMSYKTWQWSHPCLPNSDMIHTPIPLTTGNLTPRSLKTPGGSIKESFSYLTFWKKNPRPSKWSSWAHNFPRVRDNCCLVYRREISELLSAGRSGPIDLLTCQPPVPGEGVTHPGLPEWWLLSPVTCMALKMRSPVGTQFCHSSSCPVFPSQIPVFNFKKRRVWRWRSVKKKNRAVSFRIGFLYMFWCFVEHSCLFKCIDVDNKYLNYLNNSLYCFRDVWKLLYTFTT